ncbi:Thiamin-phosphate pyrophosphorylase [Bacillus thermotolerans]|uniref:Thiamin-phosphate pyrophosphorylase n=1 Tax=Bacillus thermotolerans TaxID=1221996 RepID=A0A0F5HZX6_BACTR|nr:Thiamin-phosphate pyrophosphorylase [Bacillus thermotolerans]KKB42519.1 Thiamin-phosphate pyrophosphorylase [Bacillus thermotolerans]KKB44534.1 Thiamin-phosphate pyrophosphorylase [Bacillus thermotolerans]
MERFAAAGVPLGKIIINDRLDVALAAGAGGVQLTEASLPLQRAKEIAGSMKLGRSVHQTKDALEIKKKEAEWLIFGHVFPTASKPDRKPAGLRKLKEVSAAASVPVIAIGGIQARHIQDIAQAGAEGIAVMSGIFTSGDPIAAAAYYRQEIQRVEEEHNENYSEWQTGRH